MGSRPLSSGCRGHASHIRLSESSPTKKQRSRALAGRFVVGVCDEKALVMSRRADIGEEAPGKGEEKLEQGEAKAEVGVNWLLKTVSFVTS